MENTVDTTEHVPTSAALELMKMANLGADVTHDATRKPYLMTLKKATAILDMTKAAMKSEVDRKDLMEKSVSLNTNATYYNLRTPGLLFSPTITPVRNSLKRNVLDRPGSAINWKTILGLTNNPNLMGWVPEGRRAASISYSYANSSQPFATMSVEDDISDEAKFAAVGFEDEEALLQLRMMMKLMQIEEPSLLHGNNSLQLGVPSAPVVSAVANAQSTLPAATYSVIVVALTAHGFQQMNAATGLVTQVSVTSNDGQGAFTVNGGCSNKSANATQVISAGQSLQATVTVVNGAVGYAWFIGPAGSETLQTISTLNSINFATTLAAGRQAATAIAADYSTNSIAFDGLMTQAYKNNAVSYINTLATGTAGIGTQLTAVGNGEVLEIRNMLKSMWDQNRVSITRLYVNSQELASLTKLVMTSGSAPLLRINEQTTGDAPGSVKVTGGAVVGWYFNPYTADGGRFIPIIIHPNMVAGTLFGYAEVLPATYMSNETPTVAEVILRQDYTVEKWARTARRSFYGVFAQEAVAVYAPFCLGIITNIAPS